MVPKNLLNSTYQLTFIKIKFEQMANIYPAYDTNDAVTSVLTDLPKCYWPRNNLHVYLPVWTESNHVPIKGANVCPGLDTRADVPNISALTA